MNNKQTVIYYNPKCSKCRMSLGLLEAKNIQPQVIEYLHDIPEKAELLAIISKLGISARQLLRTKEAAYQAAGLSDASSENEVIEAMLKYPILIERPIVIHNNKAVIGRPPEKILEIL